MRIIIVLLINLLIISCQQPKYEYIGQEIIDGKVSAIAKGHSGRIAIFPRIWVQTPTTTKEVEIPFKYEDKWKVGDSCLLIIEKYKEIEP